MAWIEPKWDKGGIVNVNQELSKYIGDLDEETARRWLGQFLMYNIQFTTEILFGMKLHPRQAVLLKTWFHNNYNLAVWGRGAGKTVSYTNDTKLLAKNIGYVSLPELIPNVSFEKEGWVDIPTLELWNGNSWQKTDKIYVQPSKNCLTAKTRYGYSLTGSTNHLIKVLNPASAEIEWKRYSELKTGDYVCISRKSVDFEPKEKTYKREAYLLGLLVGDGSYGEDWSGARLTSDDQETIDWVYKNWEISNYLTKEGTTAIDVCFSSKLIKPLFEEYGVKRGLSYYKEIPKKIKESKNSLRWFLSGLFDTDGSALTAGGLEYSTTSIKLAEEVHSALLLFGIVSRLKEEKTDSPFGKTWKVKISGHNVDVFSKEIGFQLTRKKKLSERFFKRNTNTDIIPGVKEYFQANIKTGFRLTKENSKEWRSKIRRKSNQDNLSYDSLKKYTDFAEKVGMRIPKNIREIQNEQFFFDQIEEITESIQDCLDFNVPNGEMYWCNGFINHNSSLVGIWSALDAVFTPNTHTLIISQNFRSSRRILENLEKLANSPEGNLFKQCLDGELSRRGDIWRFKLKNESTITAVPLSGGEGLRGLRCSRLIIDEALLISLGVQEQILKPFLVAGGNIKEKLQLRELEDRLIAKGLMKEEDREVFASTSKMILLSSASYQWEDLYKTYQQYLKNIENFGEEDLKVSSYSVTQISYKAVPKDLLDPAIIKDVESGDISQNVVDREYGAVFVSDSAGYFKASKMAECTVTDGQRPIIEIRGESGAEYVLGIDVSLSSGEASDHFAMSVLKIVQKGDKKIGMLVHSYAVAGGAFKDHVAYLYYLITHFNIVYIGIDASQGDNEFITQANETQLFKEAGLELRDLEADFNKEDQQLIPKQVAKSYNLQAKRIVQKQGFSSSWQRAACEYLQACIDYKNILFAGKAAAVDGAVEELGSFKPNIIEKHPSFQDGVLRDFIENQDYLIDLTKAECALIEVTSTPTGGQSFDLPAAMTRNRSSPTRKRKDNFSSLLLANWCLRVYLESQNLPKEEEFNTFTFFFAR
jgi:hypothetical protein